MRGALPRRGWLRAAPAVRLPVRHQHRLGAGRHLFHPRDHPGACHGRDITASSGSSVLHCSRVAAGGAAGPALGGVRLPALPPPLRPAVTLPRWPPPPPPLLTAALAPLQTNPKLHDTIIERLMDTFPAVRASRVASCALWIISEYCTRRWGLPRGRVVVVVACSRRAGGQAGRQRGREPPARIPPPCCLLLPTVRLPPAQRRGDFRCRGDDQGVPGAAAAVQGARGG